MDYWEKLNNARLRDDLRIVAFQKFPPKVGQTFNQSINQKDRLCAIVAIHGTKYAYDYEMPNGRWYYRVGDTATGKERTVSDAAQPAWLKSALDAMPNLIRD